MNYRPGVNWMMAFGFPETIKLVQRKGEESARPFTTIAVTRCPMQLRSRFPGTHCIPAKTAFAKSNDSLIKESGNPRCYFCFRKSPKRNRTCWKIRGENVNNLILSFPALFLLFSLSLFFSCLERWPVRADTA